MIALPGVCRVCREPVVWNGHRWRDAGGYRRHRCPEDRPTCGAWMPRARELCARKPGHAYDHRSRYAMDNARAMRSGRALARASAHTARVGSSDTPTICSGRPPARSGRRLAAATSAWIESASE